MENPSLWYEVRYSVGGERPKLYTRTLAFDEAVQRAEELSDAGGLMAVTLFQAQRIGQKDEQVTLLRTYREGRRISEEELYRLAEAQGEPDEL